MKVGDYVRTKDYGIKKISSFYVFDDVENIIADDKFYYTQFPKGEIIGESKENIIDLIEVGDYVNGFRVNDSSYGLIIIAPTTDIWEMNSTKNEFKNNNLFVEKIYKLEDIEIKSVITKEQFESMEYKL